MTEFKSLWQLGDQPLTPDTFEVRVRVTGRDFWYGIAHGHASPGGGRLWLYFPGTKRLGYLMNVSDPTLREYRGGPSDLKLLTLEEAEKLRTPGASPPCLPTEQRTIERPPEAKPNFVIDLGED